MKKIWKYALDSVSVSVDVPDGGVVRYVSEQHGGICVWIEVNPINLFKKRIFEVMATGQSFSSDIKRNYLGSVKLKNGMFVFHVYERTT